MPIRKISLPQYLEVETYSMCNRICNTCLRNSIPDRDSVTSWFNENYLHVNDFKRIMNQARALGINNRICLSHYNEPLMDPRIVDLISIAKKDFGFNYVFFCSNADFLTEELAKKLDGLVDMIGFAFYMDEPQKSQRMTWVKSLFKKTNISLGKGDHMITHFSPKVDVIQLSDRFKSSPCHRPKKRLIINHRGDMLLCCDDLVGKFNLGNIHDSSLEELWFSEKHQNYVLALKKKDGRSIHSHCLSCPRH